MSRAQISPDDPADQERRAAATLTTMLLKHGRSFSGNERNCCFLNTHGGRFANVSAISGIDFPDDGRALASVDWDQDGDLDLWISNRNAPRLRFLRNNARPSGHFLALRLVGDGQTTNRDAVGARVEVVLTSDTSANAAESSSGDRSLKRRSLIQTLRAGEGFLTQSSKWLHFGLGEQIDIDSVVVHWPGGATERFRGLNADSRYELVQHGGAAVAVRTIATGSALRAWAVEPSAPTEKARIPLVTLLPVPALAYETDDGRARPLPIGGRPLLVNLWASWCAPCLEELAELGRREKELRDCGIEVLALSVDGLDVGAASASTDSAAAREALARLDIPFPTGKATPQFVQLLQTMHDQLIVMHRPLPVPCSFLIDERGRLAVIYKGTVSVDDVLGDVRHSSLPRQERFARAALLAGRVLDDEAATKDLASIDLENHLNFAAVLLEGGALREAEAEFVQVLKSDPDVLEAQYNLGNDYLKQGRLDEARTQYERALTLDPNYVDAHNNLGLVLARQGDDEAARQCYLRALRIRPAHVDSHNNLGLLYAKEGRWEEARLCYERALKIDPRYLPARNNLGRALTQQGHLDEARKCYERALQLDPDLVEANYHLACLWAQQGDLLRAKEGFQRTLAINPKYARALQKLAWLLATAEDDRLRDGPRALELARRAAELTNFAQVDCLEALAAAYAETGDFAQAIRWQREAIRIAPGPGDDARSSRLELFRQAMPFRTKADP